MILLILLYLSLSSSLALPTPPDLPTDIPPSLFTRNADIFGTRSIWGIFWSCFSTLFACTWVAVHPNIPDPKDSRWVVLGRRVAIMGNVLIAPEVVILWAARQHIGVRRLAAQHKGRGWTMTHGFFLIMGGFTLHDEQGTALRILEPNELEELSKSGKISWPSITEEEIQDRSKGDYLSKAIVLLQTSWFINQCILRGAYRLEITELEVATLAFAALTGVTYYLWWHKPLDVRCSVPVYLLKESLPSNESQNPQRPLIVIPDELNPQAPTAIFIPPHNNSTSTPEPNYMALMQGLHDSNQRQRQDYGAFLGLIHVLFLKPFFSFFRALGEMGSCHTLHESSPLRVPTFYGPEDPGDFTFSDQICAGIAVIFGGIHCIAWSFHFPSLQERLAWRISAAFVFGFPLLFIALLGLERFIDSVGKSTKLGKLLIAVVMDTLIALTAIYAVARITLLVLPCIALRALPAAAFVDIQWASFIPHIG